MPHEFGGVALSFVSITVNVKRHKSEIEPRLLLVHFSRDVLGLTGTHVGFDASQCGAYTVSMNGVPSNRAQFSRDRCRAGTRGTPVDP